MKIIRNLNLRNKLLLILFTLFLPLIYFSVKSLINEKENADSYEAVYLKLQDIHSVSEILFHVQRERGLSHGYILSSGKSFIRRLNDQRALTDRSISNIQDPAINNLFLDFNIKRSEIDALKIDQTHFDAYFANLVLKLSEKLEVNLLSIDDATTKRQMDAYSEFLKAQFYMGQIRSKAIKSITVGNIEFDDLLFITGRKSLFDASTSNFLKNIVPEVKDEYVKKTNEDLVRNVNNFIKNELGNPEEDLSQFSPLIWFDHFTNYIEILKGVGNSAIEKIEADLVLKKERAEKRLLNYALFIVSMLALAILLSTYIINGLLRAVLLLKNAADKVAEGDAKVTIPHLSNDEIGSLAKSFNAVVNKNNHLAKVSNEIGKGNYDVEINISGEQDLLSNALQKMKHNLKRLSDEDKKRNWILTGAGELNDLVSEDRQLSSVSEKVIRHICNFIEAEIGALYLLNDRYQLELTSGYSFKTEDEKLTIIDPDNNFMGQALKEHKILRMANVHLPEFTIKTGFTVSEPAEIIIVPLIMEDQIVGVLQLAARKKFSSEKIDFLKHIDEKIAITFITLKADLKNAELLAETQSQAEELETQQEELRQSNLELLAQRSRLQESEEELKTNQEELEEKNVELEEKAKLLEEHYEAITHKNKELEDAKHAIQLQFDELQKVGKYKSDFLANMSHELRTPLNSILILAKLIAENREKNMSPKQVEFAEVIHNSGNDLLKLINEILDLTKIEAGKLSLEVREFNIKKLNPEPLFNELAKNKEINFKVNFSKDLPKTIISDQFRVEQILKNLLSNAFKFTEKGGEVKLDVYPYSDEKSLSKDLTPPENLIAFAVYDSGIGISKNDQKVIFNAFQQADSSTTRKFGGTGLGLSICKELAHLLGGEITVTSQPGKGSCFTLYLPEKLEEIKRTEVQQPTIIQHNREEESAGIILQKAQQLWNSDTTKTILIIEDDRGFSKILADFAKSKKIEPITTHLGNKGLELAKEIKPNAILLDIQLPDISGWEVLEKLKQDPELKRIPVHVMSAYDFNPANNKFDISKENYLPKPVTLESLDKALFKIHALKNNEVKKVLIVEDNLVESKAVKELLLAHELHSEIANTGEDALKKLKNEPFDCIILDISMPGMGGYEVLEKLKANKKLKDIPVIVYTGKDFTEEEEFNLKKYVNAIVIKTDYSYKRLLDEVKLFLHKVQEKFPASQTPKLYKTDDSLKNKKVLIVDDDSRNIYSLYNAFETEEMDIIVANNGLEALERLKEIQDINIVLMDIMMPEMDGLECTRRIRKDPRFSSLPIIALTAKAMNEDKQNCLEAGASDYVTKPVNVEKLLSLMRVWINRNENIIKL